MLTVNILIDFETAAMSERAAILSIGAVPFVLPSDDVDTTCQTNGMTSKLSRDVRGLLPFSAVINATSCIMSGMEFDQNTVDWWSRQSEDSKAQFSGEGSEVKNIEQAFLSLIAYIRDIKTLLDCDICIWTQGSDFDIPKLRYCCTRIAEIPENQLPWRYNAVRDARTYVLEGLALLFGRKPVKEAYKDILPAPNSETLVTHDVLSDCYKSIWSVTQVNTMLMKSMRERKE